MLAFGRFPFYGENYSMYFWVSADFKPTTTIYFCWMKSKKGQRIERITEFYGECIRLRLANAKEKMKTK